jgi:hypothetical protein
MPKHQQSLQLEPTNFSRLRRKGCLRDGEVEELSLPYESG